MSIRAFAAHTILQRHRRTALPTSSIHFGCDVKEKKKTSEKIYEWIILVSSKILTLIEFAVMLFFFRSVLVAAGSPVYRIFFALSYSCAMCMHIHFIASVKNEKKRERESAEEKRK